jgi:hypothetical protein
MSRIAGNNGQTGVVIADRVPIVVQETAEREVEQEGTEETERSDQREQPWLRYCT